MKIEHIRQLLVELAKEHGPAVSNIAKVKEVNEQKATCVLVDEDGQEIFDVRLRPVLNENKSLILIPKLESYVLAVRIEDNDEWFVVGYDQIDKVGYYIDQCVFEIDSEGFLLKKQNETLKKIMVDLVSAIKSIQLLVSTTGTASAQTGQTTTLVNMNDFLEIETRINEFLK